MEQPQFHITSQVKDDIEEVWIASDTTAILLIIEPSSRSVVGFSSRLERGIVAEMGFHRNKDRTRYPSLYIFHETPDRRVSWRLYCFKKRDEWVIETAGEKLMENGSHQTRNSIPQRRSAISRINRGP